MKQGNVKEMGPILGIEGGGTKTSWVFIGVRGRVLARGNVGPTHVMLVGEKGLREAFGKIAKNLPTRPWAIGG